MTKYSPQVGEYETVRVPRWPLRSRRSRTFGPFLCALARLPNATVCDSQIPDVGSFVRSCVKNESSSITCVGRSRSVAGRPPRTLAVGLPVPRCSRARITSERRCSVLVSEAETSECSREKKENDAGPGFSVECVTRFSHRTLMGRQDARTLLYNIKSSVNSMTYILVTQRSLFTHVFTLVTWPHCHHQGI